MKRYLPGLYGKDNYVIAVMCECSDYCEGRWVQREVVDWFEGFPNEMGYYGLSANTKRELIELMKQHGTY